MWTNLHNPLLRANSYTGRRTRNRVLRPLLKQPDYPTAHLLLIWFFVCIASSISAQPDANIHFEGLSTQDGLSQSSVNCILQDQLGFLWLGTQSGLNRYNGYEVEVYRKTSGRLHHDWIAALAEDEQGDLWIGTEGGGISKWSSLHKSIQHYRHRPDDLRSISSDRIRTLTFDRSGSLWVGTVESGLNRLDPGETQFKRFHHDASNPEKTLIDDRIRSVLEDHQGRIWVGTLGGLDRLEPDGETFTHLDLNIDINDSSTEEVTAQLEIQALLEDRNGMLWIGTLQGLIRFDPVSETSRFFQHEGEGSRLSHNRVRTVFEDRDGRLWIGTDSGLDLWDPQSPDNPSSQPSLRLPSTLRSIQVLTLAEDQSGNLWLGSFKEGAKKWNPQSLYFEHLTFSVENEEDQSDNIFAISTDVHGDLWTGSFGGGIVRSKRDTRERFHYSHTSSPTSLAENRVTALLHDSENNLWAGTVSKGLNMLRNGEDGFHHYRHDPADPSSLSADGVTALHQDKKSRLWIGTYGGGLNQYLGEAQFRSYMHQEGEPQSLSNDRVFAIAENHDGQLWLATDGGLSFLDPEKESFKSWRHIEGDEHSLSSDELFSLHIDARQRLWIGTKSNGLDLLFQTEANAESVFQNFSLEDGLPDPTVWGIESDSAGHMWLSTNGGLVRFDPKTHDIQSYDVSHGLQGNEFNLGAHFRSRNGELFFGGVNGLNAFFPDKIQANSTPPPVVLTAFTLLNKPVDTQVPLAKLEHLELKHDDHFLSFEFSALDFTAPEKNQYRYQLEGFDDNWVDLGSERKVSFTSLNPGTYTLRAQGSNSDGTWSNPGAAIEMIVAPPLWRTWWFRSLLLLFAAATATIAHQLRMSRIRFNNERLHALVKERTRDLEEAQERLVRKEKLAVLGELSGSVAHELRNPLGIIKNSIFFLRLTQKMVDDKAKEHLGLIEREIKRSDRIIGELLDYAKEPKAQTEAVTVQKVIEATLQTVKIPDSIKLTLDLESTETTPLQIRADPGQIESVLGNLFSNGLQAMPEGGTLSVRAQARNDEVWLRVSDTGVGIEKEDIEKIFEPLFTRKIYGIGLGLPLSQRYVQMNGGRLECESRIGEGTTFHLHLPRAEADTDDP